MEPVLIEVEKGWPTAMWAGDVANGTKPGPNPTTQIWRYNDGTSRRVEVGADASHIQPVKITSKYNRQILGMTEGAK